MTQHQYQQQQQQKGQTSQIPEPKLSNNPMTIPQAITLITLRLGRLEGTIHKLQTEGVSVSQEAG